MKRDVFVKEMARLMLFFKAELSEMEINGYWDEMKFIPSKAFVAGATKVIQTREYPTFPTPGVLLKAAVGDHAHVVSARLPHGRDVQLDDIVGAYKEIWEWSQTERKRLPAPSGVPAVVDKDKIITDLRIEKAALEADNQLLRHRVAKLEEELKETHASEQKLQNAGRRQGEELARLENLWRREDWPGAGWPNDVTEKK